MFFHGRTLYATASLPSLKEEEKDSAKEEK